MSQISRSRTINALIKCILGLAFTGFVTYEIVAHREIVPLWNNLLDGLTGERLWMLLLAVTLVPLNWLMEAKKWQLLMRHVYSLGIGKAYKAVLGGLALSILTPNRIGEYGGRILFVPARYNWYAVIATVTGSFAQNLVIIVCGLAAALWFVTQSGLFDMTILLWLHAIAGLAVGVAIAVYLNLPGIADWSASLDVHRWVRKPLKALGLLRHTSREELLNALGYSLFKYIIFSAQFALLLSFFGLDVPIALLVCGVALMYLFQTSIPLPPFLEVMLRGEVAILLWYAHDVNELSVVAASFCIWILNLVIPAFFGLAAISSINVLKSLGYGSRSGRSGALASPDLIVDSPFGDAKGGSSD